MITQIIWFLTWPLLIYVSYRVIRIMLARFDKNTGV